MPPVPIAEHRPPEEALRMVTERLRLATEAGAIGVWDWNLQDNQVLWDERMFQIYGLAPNPAGGEVTYLTWTKRVHPDDLPRTEEMLRQAIADKVQQPLDFRIFWPDGTPRSIQGAAALISDEQGLPLRLVGVNWDVTEQRAAAAERQRLVHDLGERVKELTLVHDAARLLQAERPFDGALLTELVALVPAAWQYPEVCAARIAYGALAAATPGWRETPWKQSVAFAETRGGGTIEVVYLDARPQMDEGPFLAEERALLGSLAEMLDAHLELQQASGRLRQSEAEFRALFEYAGIGMALVDRAGRAVRSNPALEQFLGYSADEMARRPFYEYSHPDDIKVDARFFRAVLEARRQTYQLEKRYVRRDGHIAWGRLTVSPVLDAATGPRYLIGMVEDITTRKEYADQFQALAQASIQINSSNTLQAAIARATDSARAIIGAHQAVTCFTAGADWDRAITAVSFSEPAAAGGPAAAPVAPGRLANVCRDGRPLRLTQAQLETHPAWEFIGQAAGWQPPARGCLAAPLASRDGRSLGVILLTDKYDGDFSAEDEAILLQLAQMASVAAENMLLFEEVRGAQQRQAALARQLVEAQELERRRLAREIHDDVSQSLTAIVLQVGAARRALPPTSVAAAEMLEQTEALTQDTLAGVRRLIAGLRPPVLDDLGLLPAVRQLAHELEAGAGITVSVEASGLPDRLPNQLETALFRISQEALANVRKHAHARHVAIALEADQQWVRLLIEDDGVGLPEAGPLVVESGERMVAHAWRVAANHYGLIGIEERAAQLNGTLQLRSRPGQGTWLRVELPKKETMPASVLICDDHAIVRAGLQLIIQSDPAFRVVGAVGSAEELIEQAGVLQPDIVITDLSMQGLGGLAAIPRVRAASPRTHVLALTIHEDEAYFFQALEAGAEGYVLKGAPAEELLAALRLLEQGGVPVPRQLGQHLLTDYLARVKNEGAAGAGTLSTREREVLRLVADGQTNKEIAQRLALGVRTVERVRAAIMESAGLHNRADLLRYARQHGLLGGGPPP